MPAACVRRRRLVLTVRLRPPPRAPASRASSSSRSSAPTSSSSAPSTRSRASTGRRLHLRRHRLARLPGHAGAHAGRHHGRPDTPAASAARASARPTSSSSAGTAAPYDADSCGGTSEVDPDQGRQGREHPRRRAGRRAAPAARRPSGPRSRTPRRRASRGSPHPAPRRSSSACSASSSYDVSAAAPEGRWPPARGRSVHNTGSSASASARPSVTGAPGRELPSGCAQGRTVRGTCPLELARSPAARRSAWWASPCGCGGPWPWPAARRERAAHLLELGARGHLLGVDRGLDAVEEALEPAHELGLGDPQLALGGRALLGEGEREPLELLDQLGGQARLELLDRGGVDVLEAVAAGLVERARPSPPRGAGGSCSRSASPSPAAPPAR